MVKEGIVLGHQISSEGLEVDQAKISTIETLVPPTTVRGVGSFLGHVGFIDASFRTSPRLLDPFVNFLRRTLLLCLMKLA